ncbi:MAG: glycosyltransferase [Candidatus Paceibacterota bacterium]
MADKKTILIFNNYYLPGYKAGGPIRSISNLVEWLGDKFNFKIITTDRDSFEEESYDGIKVNDWNRVGNADVYYLKKEDLSFGHLYKVLKETEYDAVYLNSFFNLWFSIIPLFILKYLIRFAPQKILLVPRGELSDGALDQKTFKKKLFLKVIRLFRLHNTIMWQATNNEEQKEIQHYFDASDNQIQIASNLPKKVEPYEFKEIDKEVGELRIVFLSRISPKKNLDYALETLSKITNEKIVFDIYGSISNQSYWDKCQSIIDQLPDDICIRYKGSIENKFVVKTLDQYHLFFLPTKGENFGHAIYESMLSGTPVLISDQTPWRKLEERGLGWDIDLSKKEKFIQIIRQLADENMHQSNSRKERVRNSILSDDIMEEVRRNRLMLNRIIK